MITIKTGISNPTTTFNLNGLDYKKGEWTVFYEPVENSEGITYHIGIRSQYDPNWTLQRPRPFGDWVDGSAIPYSSLNALITVLSDLLGFSTASGGSGAITQAVTSFSALLDGSQEGEIAYTYNSEGTSWLPSTLGGTYYPQGLYVWNGTDWVSDRNAVANKLYVGDFDFRVVVTQANAISVLGGTIDSTKQYLLDGVIDMGSTQITVPTTGITILGLSFDISGLISSEDNYTMFVSESIAIGSGNMLGTDYYVSVTGAGSKVYEVYDATGFNAFEFTRVNYINCTSLGDIYDYRQGLEDGTGRFGGSPSLTLHGLWRGGYRITTSIVRSLSGLMTAPLFKAGTLFQMNSRFLTDINCDLPTLAAFCDFQTVNFPNPSTIQLKGAIFSRDGGFNANDTNIFPNLSESDLPCDWDNNIGIPNTFVGAAMVNTAEVETTISTQNLAVDLNGTFTASDLQHFDSPANGRLRHVGINPREYTVNFDFILDGQQNAEYELFLIKIDSFANVSVEFRQIRVINNLQGGRDVAYYNGQTSVVLNQNDLVFWQVANITGTQNCILEADSSWSVKER